MIAQILKIQLAEMIITINGEKTTSSQGNNFILSKDEKFLFEYLPITNYVEEELKKKDESGKSSVLPSPAKPY
jgi:hypothetical protein